MYSVCISDKNNIQRKENALKEFSAMHMTPLFFDAVMGKNMTPEELQHITQRKSYLSPGEIGCALSHLGCYKDFLASDEKSAAIFEDDLWVQEKMNKELMKKMSLFIESQEKPSVLVMHKSDYDYREVCEIAKDIKINQAYGLYYTHAYLLNRPAAEMILEIQTPLAFEADAFKFFHFLGGLQLYSLSENLVLQHGEDVLPSIITSKRHEKNDRMKIRAGIFWKVFWNLSLCKKIAVLKRRIYKHYLSSVKRKVFLRENRKVDIHK